MDDLTKMMLFMFLGLIVAILMLGFHKSPAPGPALGKSAGSTGSPNPTPTPSLIPTTYPSDQRSY